MEQMCPHGKVVDLLEECPICADILQGDRNQGVLDFFRLQEDYPPSGARAHVFSYLEISEDEDDPYLGALGALADLVESIQSVRNTILFPKQRNYRVEFDPDIFDIPDTTNVRTLVVTGYRGESPEEAFRSLTGLSEKCILAWEVAEKE